MRTCRVITMVLLFLTAPPLPASETGRALPPERPVVSGLAAGVDLTSPEALGWTPLQYQTARSYSRGAWALAFASPFWSMACLALLTFTGLAGRLARAISARVRNAAAADALFVVALVVCLTALNFPLEIYRYVRERAYGFSTQEPGAWFVDEAKGLAVVWVLALAFVLPFWAAVRRFPRRWWMIGSGLGVAVGILVVAVAPVFIAPLFNTFTPLRDAALKQRILQLAHRHGIPADDVYEVDASRQSRHDNAYVAGLLGTQRIVLYDTLLAAYAPEEIEFVMGHEMGHYVLNHVWKGVAIFSLAMVAGCRLLQWWLERIVGSMKGRLRCDAVGSIAALPLALLFASAVLFALQPVGSAVSRHFERQADVFALESLGDRADARGIGVAAFQRMAARNLSDPNPPALIEWWLYSHPSMGRRIRFCAGM